LMLRWVPGHKGVAGNELANIEAKAAATGDSSPRDALPALLQAGLPRSTSAIRQEHHALLKQCWTDIWKASPRYTRYARLDPLMPSNKFLKLVANRQITRAHSSILFHLRTGHVALNKHLHRIGKIDSPRCPSC
ncbi:hypothetical protein FA95DRAFT_1500077, partial [Auriscalpium vulgare]